MRLTPQEIAAIRRAVREVFGEAATVRLFGSRIDDSARGGDLDLFIELAPGQATVEAERALRDRIEPAIDDLRLDIVVHERGRPLPAIGQIAVRDGVLL
ncbi:MAG: nucleotidyltransferase domain-containing protein [Geminicoccaceae bacterium]